ncbi:hypothetical protein JZ751_023340 [Albula glossodonta]|uniref:Uncharacterized protein n=1 Tax=Albula glossodonta TaxID=121402 RepID=A0A8T2NI55_9TELE|nr:hypothetical protein JZ751_023340 [Albula glossodonta]
MEDRMENTVEWYGGTRLVQLLQLTVQMDLQDQVLLGGADWYEDVSILFSVVLIPGEGAVAASTYRLDKRLMLSVFVPHSDGSQYLCMEEEAKPLC